MVLYRQRRHCRLQTSYPLLVRFVPLVVMVYNLMTLSVGVQWLPRGKKSDWDVPH